MSQPNRRDFLKTLGVLSAAAVVTPGSVLSTALAKKKKADDKTAAPVALVSETDPQAAALGYKADASKVDTAKWAKRAGPDGAKQFCSNCLLFNGGKETTEAQGPCTLFPGKAVAAKGWCNSWAKNPAAKA